MMISRVRTSQVLDRICATTQAAILAGYTGKYSNRTAHLLVDICRQVIEKRKAKCCDTAIHDDFGRAMMTKANLAMTSTGWSSASNFEKGAR